ncbi:Glycosyl hydrolase 5 family protein [Glycine max]|nr:Glycosyl hydrolase 5 family protein [Glycine max]
MGWSFPLSPLVTTITIVLLLCVTLQTKVVKAFPLYTQNRWIVDGNATRVKLACVNWVSHLEYMVAEGLGERPLDGIAKEIKSMGFNCVRLTWPIYLITNDSLATLTVRQSFNNLGLPQAISALQVNNPSLIDLPLIKAYQDVVKGLGDKGLMVILDNHVSKPQWCCSNDDGNGFFGDQYFDPDLWIKGLTKMATLFKGVTNVVAMSLRNELRGPRQNANDWFKYMPKGAEAVHGANPDVLVIMSGLNYDLDLSFLRKQQVKLSFSRKLVFELHWYSFSDGDSWTTENPNQVCGKVTGRVMRSAGYLLEQGYPLVLSEFGWDLRGTNQNDNSYFNCLLPLAAQLDFDWAYWTLAGSYYLREGTVGLIEVYGILTQNTTLPTTTFLLQRISAIQLPYRGPGLSEVEAHKVIFHPLTGLCISGKLEPLKLGPCSNSEGWEYTAQKVLSVKGRNSTCLQAEGEGKEAKLGNECSVWEIISDSKLHLSSKINNASDVCLDVDSNNNIVTNACKCLSGDKTCDPASQWFKLVDSTRKST